MKLGYLLLFLFSANLYSQSFKYTSKPELTGVGNSSSVAFDADGDGKSDILMMGMSGTGYYTRLYHNNGDSTFLDLGIPFPGLAYGSADVLDFNNDGLPDIVLCGFDGINKRFCLYRNKGSNLFQEVITGIPGVDYSTVKCADMNRDGWTDIIISGQSATQKIFKIYRNEGNGTFTEVRSLEGMYDGSFLVADINNDSYPDIVASGVTNSFEQVSKIYLNDGGDDFSFTERTSNIPAIRGGKIDNIDFDNDGYTDILVTGKSASDAYISQIFRNNSGESFTLFKSLKGLYYATSVTGDFNNDGFPDIILAGLDVHSVYTTICYTNNTGLGFTEQSTDLPGVIRGSISPLDLTSDNKPDILISGYTMSAPIAYIYNNNGVSANTGPDAPSGLLSYPDNDSVILKWNRPDDTETPSEGITYDFYIKKAADGEAVFTAPSGYSTGDRYVYKQGGLQDTFVKIKNLPYGKYLWSVQAVDQSHKGSAFAAQAEFNICHSLDIGGDVSTCKGNSVTLSAGGSTDVVNWYSSGDPSVSFHTGNTATVNVSGNLKVWAKVNTSIGCTLADTIALYALSLPETNMVSDTGLCIHNTLTLSLAQDDYAGDWSSEAGSITASGVPAISFDVSKNETVYVKITDSDGCISYDTTYVTAWPLPENHLPADTSACFGKTLVLKAGTVSDRVYWSDSKGKLLSDKNEISYFVENSEDISLKIINSLQCTSLDTVSIIRLSLPVAIAGKDTIICPGSSVRLGGATGAGSLQYEWIPSLFLDNSHAVQPTASPGATTEYILKVTDPDGCVNYDSVVVTSNPPGKISSGGDRSVCLGSSVTLGGNPTASGSLLPYSYQWSPANSLDNSNIANPTASPDVTTQYNLVVFAGNCVVDTVQAEVTVWPLPTVTKSDDIIIGYHESTQLWTSGGDQYRWEPARDFDNSIISNPTVSPEETTTYTVFVTDANGCESSAQVTVTIQNELFVPNLFTPNGDGKNDYFMVYGTGISKIRLRVYNTEGTLVYETTDVEEATSKGWDGTWRGNTLSTGKYLWLLDAVSTDGKPLLYNGSNKGIITLLR